MNPPGKSRPITVSIVEDDNWLRQDLAKKIAGTEGFRCLGAHASAEEALTKLPKEAPDVVIMDINLPGINGIDCVRQLRESAPEMCILMLTVYEESNLIFGALQAGASGYLLKRSIPTELMQAIVYAHSGGTPMTSTIARQVVDFFSKPPPGNPGMEKLTEREIEILDLLVKGHAYKGIANQLAISVHTVNMFIKSIYKKMHVHSRGEATAKFRKL